jgi:nucleoporin NUP1
MRWDAGSQGFSRTFGAPLKQEVHQNEAERIFMGLQASSNVATGRAKSTDAGIPMDMLGASSRDLRKAIKVPLVARQTAEKRQRERLGDNHNVLISPYGRTQSVHREEQQRRREQSRERSREQSAQMEIGE